MNFGNNSTFGTKDATFTTDNRRAHEKAKKIFTKLG